MNWESLTEVVDRLLSRAERLPQLPTRDIRMAAAMLATDQWGLTIPTAAINVAALALQMRRRMVSYRLSAGTARTVHETDLHALPGQAPRLLQNPWILEARRPDEPLFLTTSSLGGYELDGVIYLIGLQYPDGAMVSRWIPRWEARDLAAGFIEEESSPLIDDVSAHKKWAREAARFAIVFGLLLEAENAPILVEEPKSKKKGSRKTASQPHTWTIRRVLLNHRIGHQGTSDLTVSSHGQIPALSGKFPEVVPVRGHLKRQVYGPGRSLRRWIYVSSYEARRWVSPKVRIDVDVREGK